MILDEKVLLMYPPPPPYASDTAGPPPFSRLGPRLTFACLPPHILLQIVYLTFPQTSAYDEGKVERQRKTLLWIVSKLRLVNRAFYIACMHVLRSTYLPSYQNLIKIPYSSDPFPTSLSTTSTSSSYDPRSTPAYTSSPSSPTSPSSSVNFSASSPLQTLQRETRVLDRFIALKIREDVFADESELHLEREDMFKDLFDLSQPKARLEDLVRIYGVREGVVSLGGTGYSSRNGSTSTLQSFSAQIQTPAPSSSSSSKRSPSSPLSTRASNFFSSFSSSKSPSPSPSQTPRPQYQSTAHITPIPFSLLSVTFSPRKIGLVLSSTAGRRRTLVEVQRTREQKLELGAKKLVQELSAYLADTS